VPRPRAQYTYPSWVRNDFASCSSRSELESTGSLDDEGRAQVLEVMGDLARRIEGSPDEARDEEDSLGERLEEAARRFEAEHPQLVSALRQIADTLRGAGI
jgi:hypothetical protein